MLQTRPMAASTRFTHNQSFFGLQKPNAHGIMSTWRFADASPYCAECLGKLEESTYTFFDSTPFPRKCPALFRQNPENGRMIATVCTSGIVFNDQANCTVCLDTHYGLRLYRISFAEVSDWICGKAGFDIHQA